MAPTTTVSLVLAHALLAACASAPAPAPAPVPRPAPARLDVGDACPMHVQGTVVTPAAIESGTAYVFTTTTDVAELRRRVRIMARLHAEKSSSVIAATDDIEAGARLNLRAAEAHQVAALQGSAVTRADALARKGCPALPADDLVAWLVSPPDATGTVATRR